MSREKESALRYIKNKLKGEYRESTVDMLFEEMDRLEEEVNKLVKRIEHYDSPWLPIDYSQADSGKGCFDGGNVLMLLRGGIIQGRFIKPERKYSESPIGCDDVGGFFEYAGFGQREFDESLHEYDFFDFQPTHYRPIPADWIGGV